MLAACTISLVLSLGCLLWCALFSSPASIRKFVDQGIAHSTAAMNLAEQTDAKFLQHKVDSEAILQSVEGVLDSIERKRRQTSAAMTRLNANEEPVPQTRDDVVNAARQKVYGV